MRASGLLHLGTGRPDRSNRPDRPNRWFLQIHRTSNSTKPHSALDNIPISLYILFMAKRVSKKREALLETAERLFYRDGFVSVGIDSVLKESGVAKMTLYNHFPSKDALIAETIRRRSEKVLLWMRVGSGKVANSPKEKLLALFDLHQAWFAEPGFRGCYFQKACADFPDAGHPVHRAAADHFRETFDYLHALSKATGLPDPSALAEQALLLLQGATAVAFGTGATIAARRARRNFEGLIAG